MNVKFLKKVHRRYKWFWDGESRHWVLLDTRKRSREVYYTTACMFGHIIGKLCGFGSFTSYWRKCVKIENLNKYREALKKYESKVPKA